MSIADDPELAEAINKGLGCMEKALALYAELSGSQVAFRKAPGEVIKDAITTLMHMAMVGGKIFKTHTATTGAGLPS